MTFRLKPARLLFSLSLLAGLGLSLPAWAGMFDDDIARKNIELLKADTTTQLQALSKRQDEASRNQLDFAAQQDGIKADLARLQGLLDEINFRLEAAEKRQKDFYVDLDNRLRKLETASAPTQPAEVKVDPAKEMADYEAALNQLKAGRYKEAQASFAGFGKAYPASSQLPSAMFWQAYTYNQLREPLKAADLFGRLASTWPTDTKAPDALYEQAAALDTAGESAAARRVLNSLIAQYPGSEPAKKAKASLKKK